MTERIIDVSNHPARLSVRLEQLVIEQKDQDKQTVPLEEVAVLIVAQRQVVYTHDALWRLTAQNGMFIPCDDKSMPVGMLLPLNGHHLQAERMAQQANAGQPLKKRLWQRIVRAKIMAQGRLLQDLHRDDHGLLALAPKVRSGDPENVEARASRRYWPVLFQDKDFKRRREAEDQNRFLNYGYAVLRAMVARAICSAGLHPSLGVHHHNRYDSFCLADDLIEPFRPVVDKAVASYIYTHDPKGPLDKNVKGEIINALLNRFDIDGEYRTLFDIVTRVANSLVRVYGGEDKQLQLPDLFAQRHAQKT